MTSTGVWSVIREPVTTSARESGSRLYRFRDFPIRCWPRTCDGNVNGMFPQISFIYDWFVSGDDWYCE